MFLDQIIFVGDNIGVSHKLLHDSDFVSDFFRTLFKILSNIVYSKTVCQILIQFKLIGRNMDYFECGFLQKNVIFTVDFIHSSKASSSDFLNNIPSRPWTDINTLHLVLLRIL